jgi:hypothetical protein
MTVLISITDHMVIYLPSSTPHSIFSFLQQTSAGCGSLPGGVIQVFFPNDFELLLILPGLGSSFLFTLITGHSKTKRPPEGSSVF